MAGPGAANGDIDRTDNPFYPVPAGPVNCLVDKPDLSGREAILKIHSAQVKEPALTG